MQSSIRSIARAALTIFVALYSTHTWSVGEDYCRTYARHALEVFEVAQKENCENLTYPIWSKDFEHHYNWCRTVSEAEAERGGEQRVSVLRECRNRNAEGLVIGTIAAVETDQMGTLSRDLACQDYANEAANQQQGNLQAGCGYSGPQWNADYSAHYDWCVRGQNLQYTQGEQTKRQEALAQCAERQSSPGPIASRGIALPQAGKIYHASFPGGVEIWGEEDDVTMNDLRSYNQATGKTSAWVYFSHNWFRSRHFPLATATWVRDAGSVPFIRLMLRSDAEQDHAELVFTLDRIIDGSFDKDLRAWGRAARDFGTPLIVEYGTEVNGEWFSWNGKWNGGGTQAGYGDPTAADGPEKFRDAYRHIISIIRDEGASNITWVFHVDTDDVPDTDWNRMERYYPGDAWIDWIGVSVYGAIDPTDAECSSFRDSMDAAYPRVAALSREKPIVVLEFGAAADNPYCGQATWVRNALNDLIGSRWPRVIGFSWWNENWQNDADRAHDTVMRIQDTPAVSAVFRDLVGRNPNVLGRMSLTAEDAQGVVTGMLPAAETGRAGESSPELAKDGGILNRTRRADLDQAFVRAVDGHASGLNMELRDMQEKAWDKLRGLALERFREEVKTADYNQQQTAPTLPGRVEKPGQSPTILGEIDKQSGEFGRGDGRPAGPRECGGVEYRGKPRIAYILASTTPDGHTVSPGDKLLIVGENFYGSPGLVEILLPQSTGQLDIPLQAGNMGDWARSWNDTIIVADVPRLDGLFGPYSARVRIMITHPCTGQASSYFSVNLAPRMVLRQISGSDFLELVKGEDYDKAIDTTLPHGEFVKVSHYPGCGVRIPVIGAMSGSGEEGDDYFFRRWALPPPFELIKGYLVPKLPEKDWGGVISRIARDALDTASSIASGDVLGATFSLVGFGVETVIKIFDPNVGKYGMWVTEYPPQKSHFLAHWNNTCYTKSPRFKQPLEYAGSFLVRGPDGLEPVAGWQNRVGADGVSVAR